MGLSTYFILKFYSPQILISTYLLFGTYQAYVYMIYISVHDIL